MQFWCRHPNTKLTVVKFSTTKNLGGPNINICLYVDLDKILISAYFSIHTWGFNLDHYGIWMLASYASFVLISLGKKCACTRFYVFLQVCINVNNIYPFLFFLILFYKQDSWSILWKQVCSFDKRCVAVFFIVETNGLC